MATITRITTPTQDIALAAACAERSQRGILITPDDLLVSLVDGALADLVADQAAKAATRRNAAYSRATPSDQQAVDAVLGKYVDPLTGL